MEIRVAVAGHGIERVEHRGLVVRGCAEKPVGAGPDGAFDRVQYCCRECRGTDDKVGGRREMPGTFPATQPGDYLFIDKPKAVSVKNHSQYDQWQAPRPIRAPSRKTAGIHR